MLNQRWISIFISISLVGILVGAVIFRVAAQNRPQTKPSAQQKGNQSKPQTKPTPQQISTPTKQQTTPPSQQKSEDQPIDTDEILKIDTGFVQLDVIVIDQTNTPVFGLKKENFTVFEDKIQQVIESVNSEEVPISFGLVIDTSGSMRSKLYEVKEAARGLLKQMRPEDEGFLAQFQYSTELIHEFTTNKNKLEESIERFTIAGGTALLDAIITTADHTMKHGKQRRKALVIISDGLEKNSFTREKEVMQAIRENEVQVYLVGFLDTDEVTSDFAKAENKKAKELLKRLADDSGGRAFFPKDLSEMPAIAAQIAKDLRTQYIINYYPSNDKKDGSYRSIRVVVQSKDNRKLIARTRLGYFAKDEKATSR